jgi:ADP-ribose pyrophosphatase
VRQGQRNETKPYVRIEMPDYAMIVAVRKSDKKIPLVRHYRRGTGDYFWELPSGLLEEGELPLACAKREFREEVGHDLLEPKLIQKIFTMPARSKQVAYLFGGIAGENVSLESPGFESREELSEMSTKFVSQTQARRLLFSRVETSHLLGFLLWEEYVKRPEKRMYIESQK